MPKYKCNNQKCPQKGQIQMIQKSVTKFIDGELVDSGSICPECNSVMESINPKGFTTTMLGSDNICKK